uniref:Mediator of RNA polymerase II transcription subunit 14 n=1 Tax=Schistosoma mansoni TaxID=6183 RepID=A0A3Q0KQ77_SCHMA
MSERSEMEHAVARVGAGTIPLSILIEFISQKVYTDLMRLIDLLPSKTDLEKKIEIATFFSRTQHLFIRLEALVKWSNSASKVDKCEKISNFLEEQSFFLISTANALSRLLRETLVSARLPPFSVLLAIDIFTNKGYTRLPKSIKNCAFVAESVTEKEKKQALIDLNCIIQNRLSLTQLPHQFRTIKIADGRAEFVVQNEFAVTVTLMSEALDFPWRILDLKFLLKDSSMNYQNLVHPAQTRLIINQAQSRLLYRQFDNRPPLVHLYDMLHAFSLSLQLDMLHEQAQRARSKRPPDQLTIEAYRPSRCLSISYWHGLARTQYNSVMGLDGKLHPTAYLLTIHIDPTEPQRPLCVSHRPELTTSKSQLVGATVQGDCLSIETLLTRTMVARAEQMLQDLRQELLIISPGPVRLADAPLCLYVPLLWPCSPHELLQVRIDPVQGFVCTSFPLLTSLDTEFGAIGSVVVSADFSSSTGVSENFSRSSVINTLSSLESAFNQASCHRVRLVSATGALVQPHESDRICSIQSRSLRNLSHGDARWRSVIRECLEHLRLCLGLARLMQTAKIHRPFWQPFKRHLPLILSPAQVNLSSSWSKMLVRLQQSYRWPILFAQLFPNNEYYIACEVISGPLSVDYKYYLIVCSALPEHMNITTNLQGVLVFNSEINPASGHLNETGLFLQVTHFTSLIADTVWSNNPSTTLEQLCACIKKAQSTIVNQRSTRLNELLNKLKLSHTIDSESVYNDTVVTRKSMRLFEPQATVPTLARLIGTLEENILTNYLTVELSCAGIEHNGMRYDGAGCLSAITITSIPFDPPSWHPSDIIPLVDFVHEMILRPHFDPFTHRRSWQLDIVFTGIVAPLNGINQKSSTYLRHQTAEWTVARLEHFNIVVQNILVEWEKLCLMHALCYHVITNPDVYLPKGAQVYSYNLRTLSLIYGTYYLADISNPTGHKFTLALGFRPTSLNNSSDTTRELNSDDINMSNTINVDFNPHMIARQHLEELLNTRKSIYSLATTMLNTLEFFRCVEPLRDQVLSYNGLKVISPHNHCLQAVCGMLLIALSPNDLILIYRASLSLRITLNIIEHSIVSSTMLSSNNNNDTLKRTKSIQLHDAYNQLTTGKKPYPPIFNTDGWNNQMLDDKALCNLAPLPAFSKFLKSVQELFCINSDEKLTSLTFTQFAQLTILTFDKFKSGIISSKTFSPTNCRRTDPGPTLLESYLSTSLLFHAAILAIQSLDVPIHHVHNEIPYDQQQQTDEQQRIKNQHDLLENAVFICVWPVSQLTVQLSMLCQPTTSNGIESFWWRLKLQLSQSVNSCDRWPPETLNVFEEFFDKRVCSFPFQPSAVTAFFRLLLLPPHALRAMGRVLAFDLHSPAQAPVYVRIGLIGMGVNSRVTAISSSSSLTNQPPNAAASATTGAAQNLLTFDTGSDLQPGMPGIIVRPSKITLQLLITRSHSRHLSKNLIPLAQLVVVGYDWDVNHVVIYPTINQSQNITTNNRNQSDTINLNLLRLLHDTDVESKANAMATNSNDSALVQLVLLITQTVAASYPISSSDSTSLNNSNVMTGFGIGGGGGGNVNSGAGIGSQQVLYG